ncbi:MAG: SirB2 family protein [Gammaproteobacteria bacterium]|nr:SirB2 family protein [Gammaproteobacteria bacterium]
MWIKTLHIGCAALTFVSFLVRGIWMLRDSPLLRRRATRIVPHVIDSVLFLSGFALLLSRHGAFFREDWLLAKLAGVLLYIVCGLAALRPGRPRPVRIAAFAVALVVFVWIVSLARTRSIVFPFHVAGPS